MAENIKDKLNKLVFDFKLSNYRDLNESQTRISYIDRFWELLGWKVHDPLEVQVERTEKSYMGRRPDYRFIKGNKTLFFVEAKKPAEDLTNPRHIYQTKLYCWNGKVPIAILTDFEEFRPFRALGKPLITDAKKGLIKELDMICDEYPDRVDDLLATFGREAVFAGSLDELVKPTQLELRDTVDKHFLNSLSEWRIKLASLIAKKNHFDNEFALAEATQRILDRLVFLRILQDRDIENTDFIKSILEHRVGNSYAAFLMICKELAPKYNGLIFNPHPLSENLTIEASLFKNIVKELNVEDSPYRFDEIPVEVLGTIYERFLGDEISFDKGRKVVIDQKPEVRKAGGVYYTPQYIVEYIVANTVGKLLEQARTPDDVSRLKILDPACGSGSFLLGAFDALIKWHEDYYNAHITEIHEKKGKNTHLLAFMDEETGKLRLTARKKGRILQNNIYGVDIDKQATEVAQMSLYLKVLEGIAKEPLAVLGFQDALLPKMDDNIKCGNSLIGSDFISDDFFGMSERERHKINPFDWEVAFPFLKVTGGFDAVIGNPPWVSLSGKFGNDILKPIQLKYLINKFDSNTYMPNLYEFFVSIGFKMTRTSGMFSFIVPDRLGFNSQFTKLRYKILTESKIIDLVYKAKFPNITADTLIFCIKKGIDGINNHQISVSEYPLISLTVDQIDFMKNDTYSFNYYTDQDVNQICGKLDSNFSCKKLSEIANTTSGFGGKSKLITKDKMSESQILTMKGDSINKYVTKQMYWFDFKKENITGRTTDRIKLGHIPKILIRKTGNSIIATFDETGIYPEQSLYFVYNLASKLSYLYLLGIFNSKLLNYYYFNKLLTNKNSIAQVKKVDLDLLPIYIINESLSNEIEAQEKIIELVERMLRLQKELQAATEFDRKHIEQYISRTDKEIDALVYQLYALTPEEIKIVEGGE